MCGTFSVCFDRFAVLFVSFLRNIFLVFKLHSFFPYLLFLNTFGLVNNDKLKMLNGADIAVEIEDGGDIDEMWSEAWADDDQVYLRILVNDDQACLPCASIFFFCGGGVQINIFVPFCLGFDFNSSVSR